MMVDQISWHGGPQRTKRVTVRSWTHYTLHHMATTAQITLVRPTEYRNKKKRTKINKNKQNTETNKVMEN